MKIIIWCLVWMMQLSVIGAKAENLSTLLERYDIVENELDLYEQELDQLTQKEDVSLTDYKELATKTWQLKEVLEELDEQLQILYTQAKDNQVSFQITAHLENYDGPEPDRTVANGEILAFQAAVPTYGSKDSPAIGYLIWQLYDDQDQPIEGVQKVRQINENGEQEQARFRFQINNLPNGTYTVALLHQLEGGDNTKTALRQFTVEEPISINRLVVSNNTEATTHQSVLSSEDIPHGFVYFTLSEEVSEATIKLQMIDATSGNTIIDQEVIRERAIDGVEQRVGVRIDSGLVNANTSIIFKAELTSPAGYKKSNSISFEIENMVFVQNNNSENQYIDFDNTEKPSSLHNCFCYVNGLDRGFVHRESKDERLKRYGITIDGNNPKDLLDYLLGDKERPTFPSWEEFFGTNLLSDNDAYDTALYEASFPTYEFTQVPICGFEIKAPPHLAYIDGLIDGYNNDYYVHNNVLGDLKNAFERTDVYCTDGLGCKVNPGKGYDGNENSEIAFENIDFSKGYCAGQDMNKIYVYYDRVKIPSNGKKGVNVMGSLKHSYDNFELDIQGEKFWEGALREYFKSMGYFDHRCPSPIIAEEKEFDDGTNRVFMGYMSIADMGESYKYYKEHKEFCGDLQLKR